MMAVAASRLTVLVVASASVARCRTSRDPNDETAWVCPMHPDYTMDVTGKCPRCGMALVRAAPFDVRDYRLDFRTVPAVVKPGQKATLRFRIFHPGTGEPIKKFEVVHERQYHLFVISQDMEYFQHIHPGAAAGRHVVDRGDAAEGGLLQGSLGLPAGRRRVAVHRAAARDGRLRRRSGRRQRAPRAGHRLTKTVDDITATLSLRSRRRSSPGSTAI